MNQYISVNRLKQQFIYEWIVGKSSLMITTIAYATAFITFLTLNVLFSDGQVSLSFHESLLGFVLNVGAAFMGINAFKQINESTKVMHYMTIPSSVEEKFLVQWTTSLIGFVVCVLGLHFVLTLIAQSIWSVFDINTFANMPDSTWMSDMVLNTIFIHAYFFFGGAIFQKRPILKSIILFFVLGFAFIILAFTLNTMDIITGFIQSDMTMTYIENGNMVTKTNTELPEGGLLNIQNAEDRAIIEQILSTIKFITVFVFWGIGYRRFKKVEA